MKYIRTPTGDVFYFDDCDIFDEDFCSEKVILSNVKKQKDLATELFKQTGILIAEMKGGENKNE